MKVKHLFAGCLAAAGLLTGCLSEPDFEPVAEGGIPINLDGSITQTSTKVNAQGFEDKDALGLYAVNYQDSNQTPGTLLDEGNQADHVKYIFNESNWKWNPVKPVYYKDVNTNVDLYVFYPHSEPSSVSEYKFEVQKDQSTAETESRLAGYEASDFMWAKVENVAPTEAAIKVKLEHMMSGAHVILKEGTGFETAGDWDLVDKKVLVTNTTRKASIDLATGEVTPVGEAQATGIVMAPQSDGSFRAIVVPQTVAALNPLFSITIDGLTYSFKREEAYKYVPGKLNQFTITINRKVPEGEYELVLSDAQIVDWKEDINVHEGEARQYYCVHCDEPGTLGRLIKADGKNPDKIKNLKVSGKIFVSDFHFMRDSMAILQSVNLKESRVIRGFVIEAWNGDEVVTISVPDIDEPEDIRAFLREINPNYNSYRNYWYNQKDEIPASAFSHKETLVNFVFPEVVTKINELAFYYCKLLSGALIIPDDVKEIGRRAFEWCSTLSSVSFPYSLEKIEGSAFDNCNSMSGSLSLPSDLKFIGSAAFEHCTFTGSLVLPQSLNYLGNSAFYGCSGFTGDLRIPESLHALYAATFAQCSGLNGQLILHDNVTFEDGCGPYDNLQGATGDQFLSCNFQGELHIPANVTKIPNGCFGGNDFSFLAGLPEDLQSIGDNAFNGCNRLMGKIELPESLVAIGKGAFAFCNNLQEVVIPSNLTVIKSDAFLRCFQLNRIVCKSSVPPVIQTGAFDGVAKDNFTVEVPANAVKLYQADPQWSEFKRIAAHYDFSISRSLSRTLNAGKSQTYVLRAPTNYSWSVESKPDWITVSPSSGTGKTEVTVTFAEMTDAEVGSFELDITDGYGNYQGTETHAGRAGEIVFKLDDVDYTTAMTVEQYDYDYGDGDVMVLNEATKGSGVNLVFMGDCYDAKDIASGAYLADLQEAFGYYFAVEPYATYKDYFNVYAVFGESSDSGMGTVNTIRDAKFGSQYSLEGITPNFETCYEYAAKANPSIIPGQTLVVMIENTTEYGGICYMWRDGSAVACCPKSADAYPYDFRGIVQHEAGGHGFGKLADEYIYHNAFISACTCMCCSHVNEFNAGKSLGWYRNLELTGNMNEVGWSHLIFNPDYSNVVDIYEGGYFHSRGVYRSEPTSCMNNNIPYFSAISRQAIVERIMEYAGEEFTLEKFYELDSDAFGATTKSVDFNVLPADPIFNGKQHAPVYMGDKPDFLR